MNVSRELFAKYDVPAPRYTSYPTVPYWQRSPTREEWYSSIERAMGEWSLYVHIPFCESLCTYCGCNTTISRSHHVEAPYVDLLKKEWGHYLSLFPELKKHPLRQFHLGGGTPTFLSEAHLADLVGSIMKHCQVKGGEFEGSIEVDPRRTRPSQLAVLRELGFTRVSMGVQDFAPHVQKLVNRFQPFSITEKLTHEARQMGYDSVNFDLIYGLPQQNLDSFKDSIEKTILLRPDRIALYSFALVPWIKPAHRLFKDEDLPVGAKKREIYEMARNELLSAGYKEIGMDHFALPTDAMYVSQQEGRLHRNFMGYADTYTGLSLGLGVSSISETPDCFHQNEKVLPLYEKRVSAGETPTLRGHVLDNEDRRRRSQIISFMTRAWVELESDEQAQWVRDFLSSMLDDGLVSLQGRRLTLTERGRPFLRTACMALDERLRRNKPDTKVFSSST